MNAISTAMSGMAAAVDKLNLSASAVASAGALNGGGSDEATSPASSSGPSGASAATPAYAPVQLSSVPPDVDYAQQTVNQIDAVTQFRANLKIVQASDEMFKSVLNLSA